MKKIGLLIIIFLGIFYMPQESLADMMYGNDIYGTDYSDYIRRISVSFESTVNAFTGSSLKNAIIYKFYLNYYSNRSEASTQIKKIEFIVHGNIDQTDLSGLYVRDSETGEIYPAHTESINANWYGPKNFKIVAELDTKIEDRKLKSFVLIADLSNIRPSSYFYIRFSSKLMPEFETASGEKIGATGPLDGTVSHFLGKGSRPPRLFWIDDNKKALALVLPSSGLSGESFEFGIKYQDDDNRAPKIAQVWIDLKDNGKYEKFDMEPVNTGNGNASDFSNGVVFSKSIKLFLKKPGVVKFKFYFVADGKEALSGVLDDPQPTSVFSFFVGTPVIFGQPRFNPGQFIQGESLKVVMPVFYVYRDLKIDWTVIEKNSFKPFKLLRWQLGRHGIESPEYKMPGENFDFQELILFLDTSDVKNSSAVLPVLKLSYEIAGISARQQIISENYPIPKVRLRTENILSQQLVRIGDKFDYLIRVVRAPGVSLKDFKPKEINFWPLKVVGFSENSRNFDSYIVDEYLWTLVSFYIYQEPFPLPAIELSWQDGKNKLNAIKIESPVIAVVPTLGKTDNLMSVWDSGPLPWTRIKTYILIVLPFSLGGLIIFVMIAIFTIRRVLTWFKILQADPRWVFAKVRRQTRKLLRAAGRTEIPDAELVIKILNRVKILVGLNFGLAPEKSQALSGQEFVNLLVKEKERLGVIRLKNPETEYSITIITHLESLIFRELLEGDLLRHLLQRMNSFLKRMSFSYRTN